MAKLKSTLRRVARRMIGKQPVPTPPATPTTGPQSVWEKLGGDWNWKPRQPREKVLIWAPGGMQLMLQVEGVLGLALRLRGVDVHLIVCDGPYHACVRREVDEGDLATWQTECQACTMRSNSTLRWLGLPHSAIGDYVTTAERAALWEQAGQYTWDTLPTLTAQGVNIGLNVRSSIVRYLKGVPLAGHEWVVREYTYTGLVTAAATAASLDRHAPTRLIMSHGIYSDWGPALQIALARGLPVIGWAGSYLKTRFFFRPVEEALRKDFRRLSPAAWQARQAQPLTAVEEARLDHFLDERYHAAASFDLKTNPAYQGNREQVRATYRLPAGRPLWGVLAHLNWDAVCDSAPMSFASFDEWMLFTLRQIENVTDVTWLIKVHPGEIWHHTLGSVSQLIAQHFPNLPDHIRVLPAETPLNPLDFMELIDGGVTVYGTAGLELALMGKPVIVAGEAHYFGKGFTYDGLTPKAYGDLLQRAGTFGPLSPVQQQAARQYAYCGFLQRQVPLPVVKDPNSPYWGFQEAQREKLREGQDPFIDFICRQVLADEEFIMDDELVRLAEADW